MFFEGDLQSGIALAIQQAKRVVCFVRGRLDTMLCYCVVSELGMGC